PVDSRTFRKRSSPCAKLADQGGASVCERKFFHSFSSAKTYTCDLRLYLSRVAPSDFATNQRSYSTSRTTFCASVTRRKWTTKLSVSACLHFAGLIASAFWPSSLTSLFERSSNFFSTSGISRGGAGSGGGAAAKAGTGRSAASANCSRRPLL